MDDLLLARHPPFQLAISIFYASVFTSQREIVFALSTQNYLSVLQRFVVNQPVQLCSLCWGVAVLVLDGDAVDGKDSAIREPGFHPVGVHVESTGKQFIHSKTPVCIHYLNPVGRVPARVNLGQLNSSRVVMAHH